MNKILVKICVSVTGDEFDMFVPTDVPICDVARVMADGVVDVTNGRYLTSGYEQLSLKDPDGVLNPALTLNDYGIRDGAVLYLI